MKKLEIKVILLILFCFIGSFVTGQSIRKCPSDSHYQTAPSKSELSYLLAQRRLRNTRISEITGVVRIPITVHVIHNNEQGTIGGTSNSNISDQQIFSQVKVLNEDFRRLVGTPGFNNNEVGADLEIEFYLATIDPDGNPTTGITRHFNSKRQWDVTREAQAIGNIVSWDPDRYLNIWVLPFARSFIGYAEFPGAAVDGLDLEDPPANIDGVFIEHSVFGRQIGTAQNGPYTFGRTTTHEIGHWLGLIHIWGDEFCGDDFCDDTPTVREENLEINCDGYNSRCTGVSIPAMIENYMDYSADQCMNIFTKEQKSRVRAVMELSKRRRRLVLNSQAFLPPSEQLEVVLLNHPSEKENLSFQVLLQGFQDFSVKFYDILGRVVDYKEFVDFPSTIVKMDQFKLTSGQSYILQVGSQDELVTKKIVVY